MKVLISGALALGVIIAPLSVMAQGTLGTANSPMHPDKDKATLTSVDKHNGLTPHMRCRMIHVRHHRHLAKHLRKDACR